MELRDYQEKAINEIFDSLTGKIEGREGLCPCVVAPTGSGKSVIIASFISRAINYWFDFKILMLTHQKELIEQDVDKLQQLEPSLDVGIYSASLKRKELKQITFASIQSIIKEKENLYDYFDCIIVDECHLINNDEEGRYQEFFRNQPRAIIIGFTATPFRMSQGRLVEDGNIFDYYIQTIGILELQKRGYLSRLTTKDVLTKIDTSNIKITAGEFNAKDLDENVNRYETNQAIAEEIVRKLNYYNRIHCVVFCSSIAHAENIAALLNDMDIPSASINGKMSKEDREKTIELFKNGTIRALVNVSILTTGFDFPSIDAIALIRPTLSTGLYLQMVGRGLRIAKGKENCLLLDFGGNVERHGTLSNPSINIQKKGKSKGQGLTPIKVCPECLEVVEKNEYVCPSCGYEFPIKSAVDIVKPRHLFYGDPNGDEEENGDIRPYFIYSWNWIKGIGAKEPHNERWEITYYCSNSSKEIKEYLITDERISPWLRKKTRDRFYYFCSKFGINLQDFIFKSGGIDFNSLAIELREKEPPVIIYTQKNKNGYNEVLDIITQEEYHHYSEEYQKEEDSISEKQKEIMEGTK